MKNVTALFEPYGTYLILPNEQDDDSSMKVDEIEKIMDLNGFRKENEDTKFTWDKINSLDAVG